MEPKAATRLPRADKVLIGRRPYHAHTPWRWLEDAASLKLMPRKIPPRKYLVVCLGSLALGVTVQWELLTGSMPISEIGSEHLVRSVPLFLGLGLAAFHLLQLRMGPWIHYDKASKQLILPRTKITLPAKAIDHIQVASGDGRGGTSDELRANEVNIVVIRPESTEETLIVDRFAVLGTTDIDGCLEVAVRLEEIMGLPPVSQVRESRRRRTSR